MKTLIIGMLVLLTGNIYAMRCGNQLVTEGDTVSKLLAACGAPTEHTQSPIFPERQVLIYGSTKFLAINGIITMEDQL